jgi:dTDP-4-amino-4,6-dideoxygalactose transaminase
MSSTELAQTKQIPFVDLRLPLSETESRWRARLEALLQRAHFILGPELHAFEIEFAGVMRAGYAVGVSSGTSALELSLRVTTMRAGVDEVITTPVTAPFTAVAIQTAGYKPRFADVDPETLLLDTDEVGNRVNSRTHAIIPVHLYGQPADVRALESLTTSRNVHIIQDACQAHGASIDGLPFTAFSRCIAYSFYPTKNLGCVGDGGAILTDDAATARRLRTIRDGGRGRDHVSLRPGTNARLDEIQACFLRAFLPSLNDWNQRRRTKARLYADVLRDCDGVRIVPQRCGSVYHLFVIRVQQRDQLQQFLSRAGIGTGVHYPVPLHCHPAFRSDKRMSRGEYPNAEKACREVLSLPLGPHLSDDDVIYVGEQVRAFYENAFRPKVSS